ncbi:high affinity cGMP-specific 3',5'-cyclic phosphodiesterase 9A-like isoform X2 [Engystomops pustulosus]|uniref:high affinity cGMP-specific 3',5'-cyclic phosphodiesterase 9A-like isoform X2 n=1 Tax=Engystomops pustulosus TaxID=76066 RepID=UPI003AFAE15F
MRHTGVRMFCSSAETRDSDCKGQDLVKVPQDIQEDLKKPTFNVWSLQDGEMLTLLEHMFLNLNLVERFTIEMAALQQFLLSVQDHYRQNPFHNFRHGFCVTQMMYSVIHLCHLQDLLSPQDIISLMIAALCHDVDHPGLNNNYQVNAQTELASRYQNKSPLENHHCAVTMEILSQMQCNIFLHSEEASSILELKKGLIKFCDISNEVRPAVEAERWADELMEEYFLQSDREKLENLPVTKYMDRDTVTKVQSQRSFITFLLIPLCDALSQILPQMKLWMLKPLQEAKLRYELQTEAVSFQPPETPITERTVEAGNMA